MGTALPHSEQKGVARVVATPEVWLEGEAVRQLEDAASDPDCVAAVGMPDLHPGPGIPIGAAFGFARTVRPRLVGGDAGCGAIVVALGKVKFGSSVERRVRAEFDRPVLDGVDMAALCRDVWARGPEALRALAASEAMDALIDGVGDDSLGPSGALPADVFGAALGTIGGGNHFAEVGRVTKVRDRAVADRLGLTKGGLVVICHSGSRGLGKVVAERWSGGVIEGDGASEYLADLAGAVRFARANRVLLAWRLLKALGAARASKIAGVFDVVHNTVSREGALWVHRKGCAPAHADQPTVVLGSRGASSWIMLGTGSDVGLCSVAHGAGRKMKRSEARDKIRARYRRSQLSKARAGGIVVCDDTKLLYEEHPDAYKPVEPVIHSLEQAGLATRVASSMPLITVKK